MRPYFLSSLCIGIGMMDAASASAQTLAAAATYPSVISSSAESSAAPQSVGT